MALTANNSFCAGNARRLMRLPLVVVLALGLLVSLMHCCGDAALASQDAVVTMASDAVPSPDPSDMSDQQMPAHAGHCMSHVRPESTIAVLPPDRVPHTAMAGNERAPRLAAILAPFKPPRI